jgi:spore maturation protein SpmB
VSSTESQPDSRSRVQRAIGHIVSEAAKTSWELFKIIIPISIATKVLQDLGMVDHVGVALAPLMKLMGLPGELGLAWATAMVTNLYGGLAVFAAVAPDLGLTTAQATVCSVVLLIAHTMPVELRVAQKAGARMLPMALLRIVGALVLGVILHHLFTATGYLQQPAAIILRVPATNGGWGSWAIGAGRNLLMMFAVILALLILMKILEKLGITRVMTRLLEPVLERLGMSQAAAPLAIIGITLGLSYGGGLIIREARAGHLGKRDIFFSMAAMSLCHALIEDTLLMMAVGGHVSGILWARLAFTLLVLAAIVPLTERLSDAAFAKWLTVEK